MNFYYPVAAISASNDASICCRWRRLVLSLPPLFTTNKYYEIETDSFLVGSAADCRSRAQSNPNGRYPKREFRGAWIQTVNSRFRGIPAEQLKQTLISQLNALQGAGINAIIFQVRPEADALYASQYEPWSRFLTGEQGRTPSPVWIRCSL